MYNTGGVARVPLLGVRWAPVYLGYDGRLCITLGRVRVWRVTGVYDNRNSWLHHLASSLLRLRNTTTSQLLEALFCYVAKVVDDHIDCQLAAGLVRIGVVFLGHVAH